MTEDTEDQAREPSRVELCVGPLVHIFCEACWLRDDIDGDDTFEIDAVFVRYTAAYVEGTSNTADTTNTVYVGPRL